MPVTEVNMLAKGTWGPRVGPSWSREYQITYEAFTSSASDSGLTVISYTGLPSLFGPHPEDSGAFCTNIDPQQDEDDATYWIIVYRYSTRVPEFAQGTPEGGSQGNPTHPESPLDRKPKVRVTGKMVKRLTFRDLAGNPIVNSAGIPYEGKMLEIPRCVIHVTRNLPEFDYNLINVCKGAVNETVFLGYEAGRVKCEDLTADENYEQETYFWRVQGEFIVANVDDLMGNAETSGMWWYDWRLDAGFEYWTGSKLRPAMIDGQKPGRPLLLDGSGGLLNGTGRWVSGGDDPVFRGFQEFRDAPLGDLGLFD